MAGLAVISEFNSYFCLLPVLVMAAHRVAGLVAAVPSWHVVVR